jgi:AcrR family transcriptional regulator
MSQSNEKLDLRVQRTRKLIREALFELINEKGFEAVSVQDITDYAMINRTTFYRHYTDKYDLARKCMDNVFQSLIDQISSTEKENQVAGVNSSRNFKVFLNHLDQNADLYNLLFGQASHPVFISQLKEYIIQILRFRMKNLEYSQSSLPQDMFEEYLAGAYIGVIQWYLTHRDEYTADSIAQWLYKLVAEGSISVLGLAESHP